VQSKAHGAACLQPPGDPGFQAVLMLRIGRLHPAIITECTSDRSLSQVTERELTEQLWPVIEKANQSYKLGARVSKSHNIYTILQQSMKRAGRGTVQRGPTLELQKDALDRLCRREGDAVPGNESILPSGDLKE